MKQQSIVTKIYMRVTHKPWGTEGYVNISRIYVPKIFLRSNPREDKIKEYYERYNKYGTIDKPLVICRNRNIKNTKFLYYLKDEYIRFLILENEIDNYMNTYNCKFKDLPDELKYVPIKYMEEL